MNKLFRVTLMSSVLFFTGCSHTTAFDFFTTDTYYEKAISNMQKASLMRDMETKALLHAVYLNNVDPDLYYGEEYFYVAVHIIEDAYDPKKHGLKNLDYRLKMMVNAPKKVKDDTSKQPEFDSKEDKTPIDGEGAAKTEESPSYINAIEAIELDEDSKLRRTMPIRNPWNHFYLVKFRENNASTINLSFENDQYGKVRLSFQKAK